MTKDLTDFERQHEAIRAEFTRQAASWGRDSISDDLRWAVDRLGLERDDDVLDVAAGTGLLSRAMAPRVRSVVALDLTPEMMAEGRRAADREKLTNVRFEKGAAEDLPYDPSSFDMVVTRFSIHHFQNPAAVLLEMARVCRTGGRVAVIDIVAPEDTELAANYNHLEKLRDPSHTRALSAGELDRLVQDSGIRISGKFLRDVPNALEEWLDRTGTAPPAREQILGDLHAELDDGSPTGMRPFLQGERLMFLHTWSVVVGVRRRDAGEARR
ncbi:MAG: methyltransferase domain-containing protein [Acidobacteriota bacterium]